MGDINTELITHGLDRVTVTKQFLNIKKTHPELYNFILRLVIEVGLHDLKKYKQLLAIEGKRKMLRGRVK